jgi:hypothetical protein
VIQKVVHTLGVSEYTQSFTMLGNVVSASDASDISAPRAAASLATVFNVQMDIF